MYEQIRLKIVTPAIESCSPFPLLASSTASFHPGHHQTVFQYLLSTATTGHIVGSVFRGLPASDRPNTCPGVNDFGKWHGGADSGENQPSQNCTLDKCARLWRDALATSFPFADRKVRKEKSYDRLANTLLLDVCFAPKGRRFLTRLYWVKRTGIDFGRNSLCRNPRSCRFAVCSRHAPLLHPVKRHKVQSGRIYVRGAANAGVQARSETKPGP